MIKCYLKDNEYFFELVINDATKMPCDKNTIYEINLSDRHSGNQASRILFSNLGNFFYIEKACKCEFYKGDQYEYSELRVGFNNRISNIAYRLRDKYHSWNKDGLII